MTRILVADDHPVVRKGLKQILTEAPDMEVGGEASTGQEALDKVRAEGWDVVILDISMPGKSGLEVLKQLKRERPGLPVLVLSMHPEDQYAVRALRAGASGYMTKDSAPDELVRGVRKIVQGGKYVSPQLAEKLALDLGTGSQQAPHETLSDREFQVMRLIAAGKTVTEIGEELALSTKTISTYRARVLEKMRMSNNAELIHYAVRNGLVE
jgi:DNA-binding NarL/FixJ family response regulator